MSALPKESHPDNEGTSLEQTRRELARLIEREHELLDTIRRLEKRSDPEFIRLERLHALEAMSRGVAHNFNNILVGVMGYAQLIEMQSEDRKAVQNAGEIVRCAERARDLVQRLGLSVGRAGGERSEVLPLESIISGVLDATRPRWKDEAEALGVTITCQTDLDAEAKTAYLTGDMHHPLVHLVFNAVDALLESGGAIILRARRQGDRVLIRVIDNGVGMDDQTRLRMFEPFFTTKQDVGSGLGLSVVHRAIVEAGGEIQVTSSQEVGTEIAVSLPVEEPPQRRQKADIALGRRTGAVRRVLVIDDEHSVRHVLGEAMRNRTVDAFASGEEVLRDYNPGAYGVAFIDLGMPAMPGNEVARRLKALDPDLITVLVTGWELSDSDPILDHFDYRVQKPFRVEGIRSILDTIESEPR